MLPPAPVIRMTSLGVATSFGDAALFGDATSSGDATSFGDADSVFDEARGWPLFAVTGARSEGSRTSAGECEEDAIVYRDGTREDGGGGCTGDGYARGAAAQRGAGGLCFAGG